MSDMRTEIKTSCLKRLKRIEGQIRGLAGMVEDDRYCIDVVTQIAAAKAALRRVEEEILRDHVAHCVEHAISSGDKADQRRKIAELMDVVSRADRQSVFQRSGHRFASRKRVKPRNRASAPAQPCSWLTPGSAGASNPNHAAAATLKFEAYWFSQPTRDGGNHDHSERSQ
jgi:DNA-binding FrmR family transcriptional regulator